VIILISFAWPTRYIKHFRVIPPKSVSFVRTFREMGESLSNRSFLVLVSAALCGTIAIALRAT